MNDFGEPHFVRVPAKGDYTLAQRVIRALWLGATHNSLSEGLLSSIEGIVETLTHALFVDSWADASALIEKVYAAIIIAGGKSDDWSADSDPYHTDRCAHKALEGLDRLGEIAVLEKAWELAAPEKKD